MPRSFELSILSIATPLTLNEGGGLRWPPFEGRYHLLCLFPIDSGVVIF